jgi:hypothetical protein
MYAQVKDTRSELKRAEKHLKYFARSIYTDKFMIFMMVLIVITLMVVIILGILKNKNKNK